MRYVRLGMVLLLALVLTGCARASTPTPAPVATALPPTSGPPSGGDTVAASGVVAPEREAGMSFPLAGRVETVAVEANARVEEGQVLVVLETAGLEAQVALAEAALRAVRARLSLEVALAEAQLEAAQAALGQAIAQREQQLAAVRAQLAAAQVQEWVARDAYERRGWMIGEVAGLQLRAAEAGRAVAEGQVTQLEEEGSGMHPLEAAVWAASAQRDVAQARLDVARNEALTEATLAQAEATLDASRAGLEQATLRAPFAGTVAQLEVSAGETVLPGQVVLTLADLTVLRVETTDLSERDVDRVTVGQQAAVYVEALAVEVQGRVVSVAPQATTIGGDVVYEAVIELDEQPEGLRWGMSVEVEIVVE